MRISDWSSDVCSSDLFGLLGGEVAFLTTTLIVIDITLAGLFWAWGADEDVMHRLVKKVLYVGFFAFVIGNFSALAGIVFDSFAGLGLKASGASISLADFMKPGSVAATGFDAGEPLLAAMGDRSEEHTSELQSLMRISYAVFCLKKKTPTH